MHKFKNLKSSYHFFQTFSRSLRSLDCVLSPHLEMKACNVLYATNSIYIFFCFFGSLSLTASFQNSLKTRINCTKLHIHVQKLFAGEGGRIRHQRLSTPTVPPHPTPPHPTPCMKTFSPDFYISHGPHLAAQGGPDP